MGCGASAAANVPSEKLDAVAAGLSSQPQPSTALPGASVGSVVATQAFGFALEGHPLAEYNGLYLRFSESNGQPMYRNEQSVKFCYFRRKESQNRGRWRLNGACTPGEDGCHSYIAVPGDTSLPAGSNVWKYHQDGWKEGTATVIVLACSADAEAYRQRVFGSGSQQAVSAQAFGFALEGHPLATYNGIYLRFSESNSQPMYRNEQSVKFCYYHGKRYEGSGTGKWKLNGACTPGEDGCVSDLAVVADAPLPAGSNVWKYHQDGWKEGTATVIVLACSADAEAYRQRAIERIEGAPRAPSASPQQVADAVQEATAGLETIEVGGGRVRLYKGTDPAPAIAAKMSEIGALFVDPEFNVESPLTPKAAMYGCPFSVSADSPRNAWDDRHKKLLKSLRHTRACHRADFTFDGAAQSEPFVIFDESASAHDIHQGQIGNCWMLARFAAFAQELPALLALTFGASASVSAVGCYSVRLFVAGEPVYMLLDDYLLSESDGQAFGVKSNDPLELWPRLLEKAFAKLGGSYCSLHGGRGVGERQASYELLGDVLQLLSGMPAFGYERWDSDHDEVASMVTKLEEMRAWHGIAVANCNVGNTAMELVPLTHGLVKEHAYSVLWSGVVAGQNFVCLRNPWGRCEWNGSWSDSAPEWQTEHGQTVKQALLATGLFEEGLEIQAPGFKDPHHKPNANDGAFIMESTDFFNHFDTVACCFPLEFSFGRGSHADYKLKKDTDDDAAGAALAAKQLKLGFTLKDHPSSQFNGVYHKVGEFNGWPVMQNGSADAFCYHYSGSHKHKARWQFSKTNTPQKGSCDTFMHSWDEPVPLLPVGTQKWRVNHAGSWTDSTLTVMLLKKAAEVETAQKRFEEQMRAKDAAGAVLAAEQMKHGFTLKDHPSSQFDGVYHKVSECNGWPVMQNGSADAFCYHFSGGNKRNKARWQFSKTNTPQKGSCHTFMQSVGEPVPLLPVGTQTWRVHHAGSWTDSTLTVTLKKS